MKKYHGHENKFVTDFSSFLKQCSLVNGDSSLPSEIIKKTGNSLYSVRFSTGEAV